MKTKFIGIPKDQRTAMRKRARESLLYWKVNHGPNKERCLGFGEQCFYYFDSGDNRLMYTLSGDNLTKIEFIYICGAGQQIILDVTNEQWTIDLFNQLYNAKASAAK